ncbi:MAG: hypothetical protein JXQ30_15885 [Spirochaetes bacterium]|nr:hypothetical protein [Spirochaetota bacterium]
MKKVILLIMSALLIVAVAVPAMADVSWSGRILASMVTAFAPKEGKATNRYYYAYTDLIAEVDEYNKLVFEFTADANPGIRASWGVYSAYIETDLGAYFGLPVGLTGTFGNYWACTRKYEATWHATERAPIRQCNQINGVKATLDFGMGNVAVLTSIGDNFGVAGHTDPVQAIILNLPELGPVDVEAFMYGTGQEEFKPVIAADVKVAFAPVDVAAGFGFDLAQGAHLPGDWAYGVGAAADLGMFRAGAAVNGNSNDALNFVALEAGAELMEGLRADVGVGLGLASGMDTFQGAEISVALEPGASCWRVGYIITQNAYSYCSVTSLADGGLFVQGDLSF